MGIEYTAITAVLKGKVPELPFIENLKFVLLSES